VSVPINVKNIRELERGEQPEVYKKCFNFTENLTSDFICSREKSESEQESDET
jgi:hypothetical protein